MRMLLRGEEVVERLPVLSEVTSTPEVRRRWIEKKNAWVADKQRQSKYLGRNGYEAERIIDACTAIAPRGPESTTEADLWFFVNTLLPGRAPKTIRAMLGTLGSFLSSCGNWVVQESQIRRQFPNRAQRTPVVNESDRAAVIAAAIGQERVVLALYGVGRRRVEVQRAQLSDFHPDRAPPIYDVRQKGGHGHVTDPFPLTTTLWNAVRECLDQRAVIGAGCTEDSGHLVCRRVGTRLVGVSYQYLDRLLHAAEDRAEVTRWPAHSFRRGAATILRSRGADWEDISGVLGHRSAETTRLYVEPMVRRARMASALELLETTKGQGVA